jgi:hypothetical protein
VPITPRPDTISLSGREGIKKKHEIKIIVHIVDIEITLVLLVMPLFDGTP